MFFTLPRRSNTEAELLKNFPGLTAGLILCTGALRAMHSVLYGVGVYDVSTILTVVLVLVAITAIATALPTLRIGAIDPAKTLRDE